NTSNSYTGLTTVNAGFLEITSASALGSTAAGTIINAGATLQLFTSAAVAEPLTINGSGLNDSPLVGAGALVQGTPTTAFTLATWSGPITLGSDAAIGVAFSGLTLTLTGAVNLAGHQLALNNPGTSITTFTNSVGAPGDVGSLLINDNLTTGTVN